jgi:hypothetical protein
MGAVELSCKLSPAARFVLAGNTRFQEMPEAWAEVAEDKEAPFQSWLADRPILFASTGGKVRAEVFLRYA